MSLKDVIRAWKDGNYRESLSEEELAQLPLNPVGDVELSEVDLREIAGGVQNTLFDCTIGPRDSLQSCGGATMDWTLCG